MRAAFVADQGNADGTIGGAELTMREFALAARDNVQLVDSLDKADAVIVGNCVSFSPQIVEQLAGKRVVRYHNDLARHEHPQLREWLEHHATHVFTSPLHQRLYDLDGDWPNVPPPIDLSAFRPSREHRRHGKRAGACAVAPWQNPGKGQHLLAEWANENGVVDVYGTGPYVPHGIGLRYCGPLKPEEVAATLWQYETFVHLPTAPEPFGRAVVEAWAAGCKLVVNEQVGALHYLLREPEKLESAAADFWQLVCEQVPA